MTTPKAKLNELYSGSEGQPRYCTEVHTQSGLFYCTVELPNGVLVISDSFRRKKDAEQDAAYKALKKMGRPFDSGISVSGHPEKSSEEYYVELKVRIEAVFSNECVLNYKPLMEHFRASIVRKGESKARIPATVLACLDTRVITMCKFLDARNPVLATQLVYKVAQASSLLTCDSNCITGTEPFQAHIVTALTKEFDSSEKISFSAVYIPFSVDEVVYVTDIHVSPTEYYMDVLANKLGVKDAAGLLISRSITKLPYGTRVFWTLPQTMSYSDKEMNIRASTLTGYSVYGNAILAAVGSTWKSEGKLDYDNVTVGCYYRLILGKYPSGNYKLSRGAVLTAELPLTYTSKARWRGSTPRALLNEFCQTQSLAPIFKTDQEDGSTRGPYTCKLTILAEGTTLEFTSERPYRTENDATQSACLKALIHFDNCVHAGIRKETNIENSQSQNSFEIANGEKTSGDRPPIGSMVHVDYTVTITGVEETVETNTGFEFELGSGAVHGIFDSCVTSMCVGQTARFYMPLSCLGLILTTEKLTSSFNDISDGKRCLEYTVALKKYVEAAEARMESAVFSPPLSKQRIDFALQLFNRSQASSLIDLGCGSGSFLEAILEQTNNLKQIVGVDISQKSLTRGSKSLQTKLLKLQNNGSNVLESVTLYEGSIAKGDRSLCDFDVATCLEVVEHMDAEPLSRFGESVLGVMRPKVLVVSTPNIEYNPILQGLRGENILEEYPASKKADTEDSSTTVKLRNDDHRFEWTRAEFQAWANELAGIYGYSVEFSGVGGIPGEEPGFASQIAVFTRMENHVQDDQLKKKGISYSELWRWSAKS